MLLSNLVFSFFRLHQILVIVHVVVFVLNTDLKVWLCKVHVEGASLVAQWLRLCPPVQGTGSVPSQGAEILCASWAKNKT